MLAKTETKSKASLGGRNGQTDKIHDLFLKKSSEMRSGQIFLERLRRDELDLPKKFSGMHMSDRF